MLMANGRLSCPKCSKELEAIYYKTWGTKRYSAETEGYEEDEALGAGDIEFTCPHCEAELDAEKVLA